MMQMPLFFGGLNGPRIMRGRHCEKFFVASPLAPRHSRLSTKEEARDSGERGYSSFDNEGLPEKSMLIEDTLDTKASFPAEICSPDYFPRVDVVASTPISYDLGRESAELPATTKIRKGT